MSRILMDPTAEREAIHTHRSPRPQSLQGKRVGLLDISKARGDVVLNRLEHKLIEIGARVKRYRKPTFTRPAPTPLIQQICKEVDVVAEALAD